MTSLQFPSVTMAGRSSGMIALFDVDGTLTSPRKVHFVLLRIKLVYEESVSEFTWNSMFFCASGGFL